MGARGGGVAAEAAGSVVSWAERVAAEAGGSVVSWEHNSECLDREEWEQGINRDLRREGSFVVVTYKVTTSC